jgi:aerobic carbon-monoxide dehydrogenase small subunit
MPVDVSFVLNGKPITVTADPLGRLLDLLRVDLGLTGTKEGCGEGECGACAVIVDGELADSCLVAVGSLSGSTVETIEGFRETDRFRILEKAYADAGAVQCGFCTPGMIMASEALLRKNPRPDAEAVREGLSGNLCRCTGYGMIVEAVLDAAEKGSGSW